MPCSFVFFPFDHPAGSPRYMAPAHHQEGFRDFDPLHFELPEPLAFADRSMAMTQESIGATYHIRPI